MTPAQRDQLLAHLARVRLVLFVLLADPTVSALVHQWALRVPLIGVMVWAAEVIVRTVRPVQAAAPDVVRPPGGVS